MGIIEIRCPWREFQGRDILKGCIPTKKTRILIVEDNRVLLEGLTTLLNGEEDMHVVATIRSGNNVLLKAGQTKPDVILMDWGLKSF